ISVSGLGKVSGMASYPGLAPVAFDCRESPAPPPSPGTKCRASVRIGSTVTLQATPDATPSQQELQAWGGGCAGFSRTNSTCQLSSLSSSTQVTAAFEPFSGTWTACQSGSQCADVGI